MISTTQQGVVHSRLERAKEYIHAGTSLTPPPTADGRDVTTAGAIGDGRPSTVISPTGAAVPDTEMIEEESTEDVAHLLTIVADIAAREAPLPVGDDDDVFGGRQQQPMTAADKGQARIRAVSMASPDLRPHPPPSTPIGGGVYSLTSPQMIPPSPAVANDFRPPIRRHGAPIQERSYDEDDQLLGQSGQPAYSYSSSSSSDEGGQYLWSATAGPREQRQTHVQHVSSSTTTPPKKKTPRHRHRNVHVPSATAVAGAARAGAPRRPAHKPKKRQPRPNPGSGGTRKVLHKKFSWKNYPELEEFLIANRDEYLRHSTLNYTVQQKQYNNRLTERLLELAADCGYIFDEHEFSFVAVRDRIRCYYKSYVQSLKKRGIVIGYAARKAGLVTNDDLEKSACKKATIYVPNTMKH